MFSNVRFAALWAACLANDYLAVFSTDLDVVINVAANSWKIPGNCGTPFSKE